MKRFVIILFLVTDTTLLSAQSPLIDSLRKLLPEGKEDTTHIMVLFELSIQLTRSNFDSAFLLGQEGLKLSKKIKYPKGELYSKISIANCFWSIGDYSAAIRLALPEVKNVEATNDNHLLFHAYAVLGSSYRDQGDNSEALKYAFKGIDVGKTIKDCKFCKSFNAAIAAIFLEKNELDSAKHYLRKSLLYPPSFMGFDGWPYSVAGRIYTELKKYDSAFICYHISIQTQLRDNNLIGLAGAYNNISSFFMITGQKDSALFYARKSLTFSQPKRFAKEILGSILLLSELYEKVNTDSSLYYYKQAMAAKDSLYNQEKQKQILSYKFQEELLQQEIQSKMTQHRNQIKIYSLVGLVAVFLITAFLLFRNNRYKQKAYTILQKQTAEIDAQKTTVELTLEKLKSTQSQLIQSEKMASLGELTAGIAHEIQNPLNFVNNFSEINKELVDELQQGLKAGNIEDAISISNDIKENEEKINHHGKKADAIVKGMLQHSRSSSGRKEATDINSLVDEYLRLAYHGMRAKDKSFTATTKTDFDDTIGKINVVPQDIGRVILNLINNAFYAIDEKKKQNPDGYEPTVSVSTKKEKNKVEIKVKDNGHGIPQKVLDKIFQPFFTTKPTGQGTGLGLSLAYDIVKAHGGELRVNTSEGKGSEFIISLSV